HFAARRRPHPVFGAPSLATAHRACFLDPHRHTRLVLARLAVLGAAPARPLARPPGSPAGPRRAAAAAPVAARARVGGAGAVRDHVRTSTFPDLIGSGEQGAVPCGASEATAPSSLLQKSIA